MIEKLFQKLGKPAKPNKRPSAQKKDRKDDAPKKRAKEVKEERPGGRKAATPDAAEPEASE